MGAAPVEDGLHQILNRRTEPEHTGEDDEHGDEKQRQADQVMHQHPVQAVGKTLGQHVGDFHGGGHQRGGADLQGVVLGQANRRGRGQVASGSGFPRQGGGEGGHQFALTLTVLGADRHYRLVHAFAQTPGVDGEAQAARLVNHVHRHHRRLAQGGQLHGQDQLTFELGGIDRDQQEVDGLGFKEVTDQLFVVGIAVQVINARQVDEFDHLAADQNLRRQQIDGDAGPVADPGRGPGQAIEQGGLARIGHAQQGDALHEARGTASREGRGAATSAQSSTHSASLRRMITSVWSMRT